ncbi:hypothetical protein [Haloarcula amylovorans]|uniref:hypothetical protein n=1 Tax=Haloarcula amylovorans TaxID=2562280 RepID=UPI0010764BE2|nr:hypothetical protein [Halomicroarcula amylolytica]
MRETTSPTEGNELFNLDSDSRRSFLKKGALASSALALGVSGTAAAQETDGGVGDLDDNWKALTFIDNFHPNARFTFVSGVVEWTPNYGDVQDSYFSDYNTYMIRWLNTDNVVPLFVAQDANIGEYDADLGFIPDADDDQNQPQLFEMNREWTPFGDNERLITVNASPVSEEDEDEILDNDDWWQETQNSGTTPTETTPTGNGN